MGIQPIDDIYNNFCPRCFAANKSPQLLKLCVSGVEKSPNFPLLLEPAPNGYADITQGGPACEWTGQGLKMFSASINWLVAESRVRVETRLGVFGFTQTVVDVCERWFENAFQNPAVFAYNFGFAYVATPFEMATWIETALPVTGPDPRMELMPMEGRQIVIRFASTQNGTNIKLRFDVDDL